MQRNIPASAYVLTFLLTGSLTAQISASLDNLAATVTTADSGGAVIVTRSLPLGPIQNGAVLDTGAAAAPGIDAARLRFSWQNATATTLRYDLSAEASATGNFSYGCYCVLSHYAVASAQTDLWLSAPQSTQVRLRISFTTNQFTIGATASVDLDLDGNPEFVETYAGAAPREFFVTIGPVPTRLRANLASAASLQYPPVPNGHLSSLLRIEATPALEILGGQGQVAPSSEPFAQPLVVRVLDSAGQILAGAPVTFAVSGPVRVSPTSTVTDANGIATTAATALAGGGLASVHAVSASLPTPPPILLFVRNLEAVRTANSLDVSVTNAPVAAAAQVPMLLAIAPAGITPLQTFLGPICTNPFDPGTLVFEDSLGLFGFVSLSGQGANGAPDLFRSYLLPPGVLSGVTIWMQGVGLDPERGLFRTNCAQRTL